MPDRRRFLETVGIGGGLLAGLGAAESQLHAAALESPQSSEPGKKVPGHLRVALMQAMPIASDQEQNLKKADSFCRVAASNEADILLMPEMWNIGYRGFNKFDEETTSAWQGQAVPTDGPWVNHFVKLASELEMAIGATYLQEWSGEPRNAISLINRKGEIALTYAKVHTCDFAFEAALTPGDGWSAADLDTAAGKVRIGLMICFDREFPESARSLMLAGSEVVLTPNACLLDDLRLAQFQVRGVENCMAMVMTNYPAPQNNGRSVAYDMGGTKLVEASEQEGLFYADVDLGALRFHRERTLWGNAWRRPENYKALTEKHHLPVFQRKDAYGTPFDPFSS